MTLVADPRAVTRDLLIEVLRRLDELASFDTTVYLIGETSQLLEGSRRRTQHISLTSRTAAATPRTLSTEIEIVTAEYGVEILDEHPGEIIPLPDGHADRARRLGQNLGLQRLDVLHFDPYSVAFRFIARGDEPDYHLVLTYMRDGWIDLASMNSLLDSVLPRFSMETIQQDPAEFRRKYKGLLQMSRAVQAGTTHRPTSV